MNIVTLLKMKMINRIIGALIFCIPINILGQDLSKHDQDLLNGLNELKSGINNPEVNFNPKLKNVLLEFELSQKSLDKIDSTFIYNTFNKCGIYDFNFEINEFKILFLNYSNIINELNKKCHKIISNKNLQDVGIITSRKGLFSSVKIIATENYININDLKRAEGTISLLDNEVTLDKVIISGTSKVKMIKYVLSDVSEYKRINLTSKSQNNIVVKEDGSFEIEVNFPKKTIKINNSLFILDSLSNILSFYIIR